MQIKIEFDKVGYILFVVSGIFLLIYVCILIWQEKTKKRYMREQSEIAERLRVAEKRISNKIKESNNDSTGNNLD